MQQPLTITQLDSLRAEIMMALLSEKGRQEIWKYDILKRGQANQEAVENLNFDNMHAASSNRDKPYALVGPGIEDSYFGTVAELVSICYWIAQKHLGGEYAADPNNTYANQQALLAEGKAKNFPFIPLEGTRTKAPC